MASEHKTRGGLHNKSGRIGRLDEHTLAYYRRVSDTINGDFDTQEDKDLFVDNVFKEMCQDCLKICRNQTVSHIVETMLHHANRDHLRNFLLACSKDWELMSTDRFACHVCETVILKAAKYINSAESLSDEAAIADIDAIRTSFGLLCDLLSGSLAQYMQHTYASHVVRTVLEVLGGVKVKDSVVRSRSSRDHKNKKIQSAGSDALPKAVPASLKMLKKLVKKMVTFPHLTEFVTNSCSGPVLQAAILVLKSVKPSLCDTVCQQLIQETDMFTFNAKEPSAVLQNESGSHLVEQVMSSLSGPLFSVIVEEHLKGKLALLACNTTGQYIIQRLIESLTTKDQLELVFNELSDSIEDLFALYHVGVLVKMAEACSRLGAKQEQFLKILLKAFHCYEPAERQTKCVPLIASLVTYDKFYKVLDSDKEDEDESDSDDKETEVSIPLLGKVNLHGSLLLQHMLQFGNPRLLVTSLLELRKPELKLLACDPKGSHIIDVFFKSQSIGEKSRDNFVNKIKSILVDLSCSRNGSRAIDGIWAAATLKQKLMMADGLSQHESRLQGDKFGFYVFRNLSLSQYRHRLSDWKSAQTNNAKKRKLFGDLLDKSGGREKKKKRKMTETPDEEEESASNLLLPEEGEENMNINVTAMMSENQQSQEDKPNGSHKEDSKKNKKKKSQEDKPNGAHEDEDKKNKEKKSQKNKPNGAHEEDSKKNKKKKKKLERLQEQCLHNNKDKPKDEKKTVSHPKKKKKKKEKSNN